MTGSTTGRKRWFEAASTGYGETEDGDGTLLLFQPMRVTGCRQRDASLLDLDHRRRRLVGRLPQCRRRLVERGHQLAPLLIAVASAADLERRFGEYPLGFAQQHRKRPVSAAHRMSARCS
jgi:hypothetical protein